MKKSILVTMALVAMLAAGCKKENSGSKEKTNVESVEVAPGVFWAKSDIGAKTPHGFGDLYMWGELTPGKTHESEYRFISGQGWPRMTDYEDAEAKPQLLPEDDIVTRTYGSAWRIPTEDEWKALFDGCMWSIEKEGDMYVFKGVSKTTGNEIFFPCCEGELPDDDYVVVMYWTCANGSNQWARGAFFQRYTNNEFIMNPGCWAVKTSQNYVRGIKISAE